MADNYLSESQLLLLANYEYFHCSTNNGTIKENIDALKSEDGSFDMDKVVSQGATGDIISEEDAVDILNRLENDSELSNLRMARNMAWKAAYVQHFIPILKMKTRHLYLEEQAELIKHGKIMCWENTKQIQGFRLWQQIL